jgi:uncharacterized repeat protein (TIGR01451 family)
MSAQKVKKQKGLRSQGQFSQKHVQGVMKIQTSVKQRASILTWSAQTGMLAALLLSSADIAKADGIYMTNMRTQLTPSSVTLLTNSARTTPGVQTGDIVEFVLQAQVTNAAGGPGVYFTTYIPSGVEVLGASFVTDLTGATVFTLPTTQNCVSGISGSAGCANDGWGNRGIQTPFGSPFAGIGNSRQSDLSGDTGIFYSIKPITQLYTTDSSGIARGTSTGAPNSNGNGYNVTDTFYKSVDAWNLWDANQVNAFGAGGTLGAVPAGSDSTATVINAKGQGSAPFKVGSPVAGPDTGYPLDNTNSDGPWQRIQVSGAKKADISDGAATAIGTVNAPTLINASTFGTALSDSSPLPSGTNAVRWSYGLGLLNDVIYVKVRVRINTPGAKLNFEANGSDNWGSFSKDNPWRYFGPTVAQSANLFIEKKVDKVNGVAYISGPIPPGATVTYRIRYVNLGSLPIDNVTIADKLSTAIATTGCTVSNPTLSNLSNSVTATSVCPASGATVSFGNLPNVSNNSLGTLLGGTFTYDVKLSSTIADGTTVSNTGTFSGKDAVSGAVATKTSTAQFTSGAPRNTVSGQVRNDLNSNGSLVEADLGINGVTVKIYQDDGTGNPTGAAIATTTTDSSGNYSFSVATGNYVIVETNLSTYASSGDSQGANDDKIVVSVGTVDKTGNIFLDVDTARLDYGDAPNTYGTTLNGATTATTGGARHTRDGKLYLGAGVTGEADGQPNTTATGDANDDGVTFSPTLGANYSTLIQAGVSNQTTVVSSGAGFVNAWVDYNNSGIFDAGEKVLTNQPVVAGNNTLNFNIPTTALHGATFARFRLSPTSVASAAPTGLITGGEVEDYQMNIAAPVPNGAACTTTGLLNGGFELPVLGATTYIVQSEDNIPGWNTTATDKQIEIWSTGFLGVPSFEGNQFAEMNANQVAALYQDIATVPGSTITYQFAHRARTQNSTVVVDTAGVKAGPPGALVNLKTFSTDSTDWAFYRGTYVVPAGQYITRFQFDSISAGDGSASVGNFLDAVQFSTSVCVTPISPPTIDLDGDSNTAPGNNYQNTFRIGGAAVVAADTDTVITDEKTNITRAIFTLTTTPDGANESLTIDPTVGGTVTGVSIDFAYDSTVGASTTGRLTLTGSATLADYQKVIATLKYSNTKASPTLSDRIINVQVIDSDKAISNTAISTIKVSLPPANVQVLLVKRITAVNSSATNGSISLSTYDPETDTNNPSYAYDKNITQAGLTPPSSINWPNTTGATSSTFLLGARNGGTTKTGDEIDYTIYFLSTGGASAKSVTICDRIPRYQAFVPDAFNSLTAAPNTGTAAAPGDRGIAVFQGSSTTADTTYGYTNIGDGDAARYYPPGSPLPSACTQPALAEDNGTIVVNLGEVLNATAPGTPKESYGFLRFRAKVK